MGRGGLKDMEIVKIIVSGVSVNVVNDVAGACSSDLSVNPLASISFGSIAQGAVRRGYPAMRAVVFSYRSVCCYGGFRKVGNGRNFQVKPVASTVNARRQTVDFLRVREKRISMLMPHLIMSPAHFPGDSGSVAVLTCAPDNLTTPAIFCRSMPLNTLVVHQTDAVRGMLSFTPINRTAFIQSWRRHGNYSVRFPISISRYKALGNSMAVPVMAWIGRQIAEVHP